VNKIVESISAVKKRQHLASNEHRRSVQIYLITQVSTAARRRLSARCWRSLIEYIFARVLISSWFKNNKLKLKF
jgi:hypothetical protein